MEPIEWFGAAKPEHHEMAVQRAAELARMIKQG